MSIPESHLAQEAIAALVDGELTAGPANRAARHLAGCLQCRMAVQAQREAKEALHESADVDLPGDLMSRLCAIPFTTDVPGSGGGTGTMTAGPGELTVTGASGAWSVDLHPHRRRHTDDTPPAGCAAASSARSSASGSASPRWRSTCPARPGSPAGAAGRRPDVAAAAHRVAPPVVRTVTVGTTTALAASGRDPLSTSDAPGRHHAVGRRALRRRGRRRLRAGPPTAPSTTPPPG